MNKQDAINAIKALLDHLDDEGLKDLLADNEVLERLKNLGYDQGIHIHVTENHTHLHSHYEQKPYTLPYPPNKPYWSDWTITMDSSSWSDTGVPGR
jgi:hypothetical protein